MSTVDDIDAPAGRLALALLLAGGSAGNYGLEGQRRRRDRAADRGATGWLTRPRSSSPPATRRARSRRRWRRSGSSFPSAEVIVADDGSRDANRRRGRARPAHACSGSARRGKGQALTLGRAGRARRAARCSCDADLVGDLGAARRERRRPRRSPRSPSGAAAASESPSDGARQLIRARSGFEPREPLSGQRHLERAARAACFPSRPGFGCEVRMTIDAARAGLDASRGRARRSRTSATGRDLARLRAPRRASSSTSLLAAGPLAVNHRGAAPAARRLAASALAAIQQSPPSPRSVSPTTSGRARARLPRAPAGRPDDRASSSSSASRSSASLATRSSRARSSSASPRTRSTSSTRGRAAR